MDGLSKYILARRLVSCYLSYRIFNKANRRDNLYVPWHIRSICGLLVSYTYLQYVYCIRNVVFDDIGHIRICCLLLCLCNLLIR